jgi:Xaa-Pro aminopeptidase
MNGPKPPTAREESEMQSDLLRERVIHPISTGELERRWKAVREVMKDRDIDFLLIQNNNDYLGGYIKWFTDLQAIHAFAAAVIFPREDEMTTFWHGSREPKEASPEPWLLRGVKKRISTPIMLSMNYTTTYDGEKVVEELKGYGKCRVSFVNERAMTHGFVGCVREHLTGAQFVDITDEIDAIKAIKSPEEIDCIKASAHIHDEAMKACFAAIRPGAREFEIAAAGRMKCRMMGSEQQFILIGSAPVGQPFSYSSIHAMNRELKAGDQIAILIEATDPAGYYTHLHRIACMGSVSAELQAAFEDARDAQKVTLDLLKPGADSLDFMRANNEFMMSRGYPKENRLYAHSQGYDLVERPSFQPGETMKVKAGMNIAPHPVVAAKHATAIICDNYIVGETGVGECLHKFPKEITVL